MRGVLHFYSETGTEGGYWAFQAEEFITKEKVQWGVFAGSTVYDAKHPDREGTVQQSFHQDGRPTSDPINYDPDYFASSLFRGQARGDREADARLAERWGITFRYQDDGMGTPATEPRRPFGVGQGDTIVAFVRWHDEPDDANPTPCLMRELVMTRWSYEGQYILKDGDHLRVFQPDGSVRWEGDIKLVQHKLFTEHASNMWIHADQEGIDRDEWASMFFEGLRAELEVG